MRQSKWSTPLDGAIAEFVAHQRVFGRGYWYQEYILKALGRFASRCGAADLGDSYWSANCAYFGAGATRDASCRIRADLRAPDHTHHRSL
jgi:hypothetical protein